MWNRLPVGIGQLPSFPTVEQPRVAAAVRLADARPELPGPVGRLPNAEIDRLLRVAADQLITIREGQGLVE